MKTCNRCNEKKELDKFQTVKIKGAEYKRLYCISCKGKQDYQVRLKKKFKNGDRNVQKCDDCNKYFHSMHILSSCVSCRNEKSEVSYISRNGNKRYYSDYYKNQRI